MTNTYHSEYLKLKSVFIKSADDAFVSNVQLAKQWKALNYLSKPDFNKAIEEYEVFKSILQNEGVAMEFFPRDRRVKIDSIYCRDATIATNFGMIICNMGKSDRINETNSQKLYFQKKGLPIFGEIKAPGTLEGGDVAWIDENTLAVGHTYRTNEEGIVQLKKLLEPNGVSILVAELPHYKGASDVFHLMSIFSPVDKNLAVVYSPLMPIKFRNELLNRGIQFIEVPGEEFESMGCNVLALSPRKCIVVKGNPITEQRLKAAGCEVIAYSGEEISLKGGGGPTCLTRPILRSY